MEHRSYIHKEAGESSLRCTCGTWKGKHPTDTEGHADHVLANRPAFIAISQVIAAAVMRGELRFTVKRGAHLGLAEDQLWCATDLCERLLATVEPHLAAEGRDAAADRLDARDRYETEETPDVDGWTIYPTTDGGLMVSHDTDADQPTLAADDSIPLAAVLAFIADTDEETPEPAEPTWVDVFRAAREMARDMKRERQRAKTAAAHPLADITRAEPEALVARFQAIPDREDTR